jgi:hypothetical protein
LNSGHHLRDDSGHLKLPRIAELDFAQHLLPIVGRYSVEGRNWILQKYQNKIYLNSTYV